MTLKLMAVPHCCGAKFFFGFPTGYSEEYFEMHQGNKIQQEKFRVANAEIADALDKEMSAFFTSDYTVYRLRETPHNHHLDEDDPTNQISFVYPHSATPLAKRNAFISAILNKKQKYVCEPVLFKHGFKLIYDEINPNSNVRIYYYTKFPTRSS